MCQHVRTYDTMRVSVSAYNVPACVHLQHDTLERACLTFGQHARRYNMTRLSGCAYHVPACVHF